MNFSHGSYEYHQSVIDNAREAAKSYNRPVAIALDTKGPEIRTGLMKDDADVPIPAGHEFYITTNKDFAESGTAEQIYMDYVRAATLAICPILTPDQHRQGHRRWQAHLRRRRYPLPPGPRYRGRQAQGQVAQLGHSLLAQGCQPPQDPCRPPRSVREGPC